MQTINRVFSHPTYDRNLVVSLLLRYQIKELSKLTEGLLATAADSQTESDIVREYNAGTHMFTRVTGFGHIKRLGLTSSGLYIAEFRNATIRQGVEEDYGHVKYNCENPELN